MVEWVQLDQARRVLHHGCVTEYVRMLYQTAHHIFVSVVVIDCR
jgi:hypothetical protein